METNTHQSFSTPPSNSNHLDSLTPEETNHFISKCADDFLGHMKRLYEKLIVLVNPKEKKVCVKRAIYSSRYTPQGRQKILRMIRRRLRLWKADHGVLLTLTVAEFDANTSLYRGMGKLHAWESIMREGRAFCDELNKWRKRNGKKPIKAFAKIIEDQPGRHYPHLHIYYPGLYFLAPKEVISKLWPYGITNVKQTFGRTPAEYIIKYLSKESNNDFMNVMLRTFRLRMYSTSKGLKYGPDVIANNGWIYQHIGEGETPRQVVEWWAAEGYSIKGQDLTIPRGG